jgi:hypothetical protein
MRWRPIDSNNLSKADQDHRLIAPSPFSISSRLARRIKLTLYLSDEVHLRACGVRQRARRRYPEGGSAAISSLTEKRLEVATVRLRRLQTDWLLPLNSFRRKSRDCGSMADWGFCVATRLAATCSLVPRSARQSTEGDLVRRPGRVLERGWSLWPSLADGAVLRGNEDDAVDGRDKPGHLPRPTIGLMRPRALPCSQIWRRARPSREWCRDRLAG